MRDHVTTLQDRNVTNWFFDLVVSCGIYTHGKKKLVDILDLRHLMNAECWWVNHEKLINSFK